MDGQQAFLKGKPLETTKKIEAMRTFLLMILGLGLLVASFAAGSFLPEYARLFTPARLFVPGAIEAEKAESGQVPSSSENSANDNEAVPETAVSEPEKPASEQAGAEKPEPTASGPGAEQGDVDDEDTNEEIVKGNIAKGDTLGKLFDEWCQDDLAESYVKAISRIFPASSFRIGQPYAIWRDPQNGELKKFEYEIDARRMLVAEKIGEKISTTIEPIKYDISLRLVSNSIDNSLFQAVAEKGEKPSLAMLLAEIFGWEINFIRDVQEGDSFSVLLEKRYRDGVFKGYGKVLGASFTNKGKKYEAFLFKDSSGIYRHFNPKGENLKKTLLQTPLSFTRVTSSFSKARRHPIMGGLRPHFGVDYAAPTGTPIKAVGDGRISRKGWVKGYGHQLVVKHGSGLESMYSHLSRYAKSIGPGSRVRQGQVIGFVGSTGYSTGPHLDFRLKQGGKFINPQKAVNPRSAAVSQNKRKEFAARQAAVRSYMQGKKDLNEYEASNF